MPVTEALANIQQIQTRLDELFGPKQTATIQADSARLFADTLTAARSEGAGLVLPQGSSATGNALAQAASKYVGIPYVFGGEDETGMDCSGLVQRAFADLGISVPRVVDDQRNLGVEVPSLDQALPGDLVVSANGGHIGIWMGNGKIIHAPYEGRTVSIVDNYLDPSDVVTIRRVLPQATSWSAAGGTDLVTAAQLAALRGSAATGGLL